MLLIKHIKLYFQLSILFQGCDPSSVRNSASTVSNSGPPPPPPPAGVPPPPPPPPPAPAPLTVEAPSGDPGANRNALFAEINQGSAITAGLKKVTDNMKTHKNPGLKNRPAVVPKSGGPTLSSAAKPMETSKKNPVKALQNKKVCHFIKKK